MQKKLIIWHSWFCAIGGVESWVYNFCTQLREYYDILVLTMGGDGKQLRRLRKVVPVEHLDKEKTYEADIVIRNSVWSALLPENIKAPRIIEMKHANYKYLSETKNPDGTTKLESQYMKDDRVTEHLACGKFVAEMYKEVTGKKIPYIQNILAPKQKTEKILRLVTCARVADAAKGWNRMKQLADKMDKAKIKYEWTVMSDTPQENLQTLYPHIHFYTPELNPYDYIADATYVVLLSDSEGLPYTVLERTTIWSTRNSDRYRRLHRANTRWSKWVCTTTRHEL